MAKGTCSKDDCDRPVRARGFCSKHYHAERAAGMPLLGGTVATCRLDGCDKPAVVKKMCRPHYMERFDDERKKKACSVKDCPRPLLRRGWCAAHYWRWHKYGDPLAGGPFRAIRGTGNRWLYDAQRRAAKAKLSQVTGETVEYVAIIRRDPCVYCGKPREHIDHIDPFADGGPTEWNNLAPACARCNYEKSRQPLLIFLLKRVQEDDQAEAA